MDIFDQIKADLDARNKKGLINYNRPFLPHDGRDSLMDLYEELLDAVAYTKKLIIERGT